MLQRVHFIINKENIKTTCNTKVVLSISFWKYGYNKKPIVTQIRQYIRGNYVWKTLFIYIILYTDMCIPTQFSAADVLLRSPH